MKIRGKISLAVFIIIAGFVFALGFFAVSGITVLNLNKLIHRADIATSQMYNLRFLTKEFLSSEEGKGDVKAEWLGIATDIKNTLKEIRADEALKGLSDETQKLAESSEKLWSVIETDINSVSKMYDSIMKSELGNLLGSESIEAVYSQGKVKTTGGQAYQLYKLVKGIRSVELYGKTFAETIIQMSEDIEAQSQVKLKSIYIIAALIPILVIIFSIIFILIFSKKIATRIQKIEGLMKELAQKNLTIRSKFTQDDEIGILGNHVNAVLDEFTSFFKKVKDTTASVSDLKDSLSAGTTESASALHEIASNIASIRKEVDLLNGNVDTSSTSVSQVGRSISELTNHIDQQYKAVEESSSAIEEMAASIQSVAKLSDDRRGRVEDLVRIVRKGGEKVDNTNNIIKTISKEVDQILEVIEIINNISEQTNILSMNAAIESAHAGEAGKGFAVVAEEIRKLAESTSENAQIVNESLKSITDKISDAIIASEAGSKSFENISKDVLDFVDALNEISGSMDELAIAGNDVLRSTTTVSEITDGIKAGSGEMEKGAIQIQDAMKKVHEISSDIVNGIVEIDVGTKEILLSLNEISDISDKSKEGMELLDEALVEFKID